MSLVLRLPRERHLARSYICPTPAIVLGNPTKASRFAHFWQGPQSLAPATRKHIWTSKSGPNPSVFYTFDFWLGNVLRATTACTFSTSQLPKVVQTWCALYILTWKCASRHKAVQLFISHLTSWLRTGRSSKPTVRTLRSHKPLEKHSVTRLSYLFAHLDLLSSETFFCLIFFLLLFSSPTLPISAFHLSILSEVWRLNFLR